MSHSEMLFEEAQKLGFGLPPAAAQTLETFERACIARIDRIQGGQDHAHARNGIRSAIEAAMHDDLPYARAGLWEAAKVLSPASLAGGA
jgi:hypothetical protein